jgi:hypothetical protein
MEKKDNNYNYNTFDFKTSLILMYNHLNSKIDVATMINSATFARSELIVVQKHYNLKSL